MPDLDTLESIAADLVAGLEREGHARDPDDLFDVLDDDSLVAAAVANGLGWALALVASYGETDALWNSTRRLIALRLLEAGETGIHVAELLVNGGDLERGVDVLVAAFPSLPHEQDLWARVAADWLRNEDRRRAFEDATGSRSDVWRALHRSPLVDDDEVAGWGQCSSDRKALLARAATGAKAIARCGGLLREEIVFGESPSAVRLRLGADGRWLEVVSASGSTALSQDGVVCRVEPTDRDVHPSARAFLTALGASDIAVHRRVVEPCLELSDYVAILNSVPAAGLTAVALGLGLPGPVHQAIATISGELARGGSIEARLTTADDNMLSQLTLRTVEPISIEIAPWLRGRHSEMARRGPYIAEFAFAERVQVSLAQAVEIAPALEEQPPTRLAMLTMSDAHEEISKWPSDRRIALHGAIGGLGIRHLPGRTVAERRHHAVAVARQFKETNRIGPPRPSLATASLAARIGIRQARRFEG